MPIYIFLIVSDYKSIYQRNKNIRKINFVLIKFMPINIDIPNTYSNTY